MIVDEFAELLAARPEFIDLFVALGRVGRSLGIHLLLSSQRLDEGRLRGLESHLRYRICLRTFSAVESKLVLGTPDAYLLPSLPGLGYLKVDTTIYEQFRAALVSSPRRAPEARAGGAAPRRSAPSTSPRRCAAAPAERRRPSRRPSDLDELSSRGSPGARRGRARCTRSGCRRCQQRAAARRRRRPPAFWEDAAPARRGLDAASAAWTCPTEQRTEPLVLDLAGAGGPRRRRRRAADRQEHGAAHAGRVARAPLHPGRAARLRDRPRRRAARARSRRAPHVGGVVGKLDREAVQRVVGQLRAELEDREAALPRACGLESMAERARAAPRAASARTSRTSCW